MRMERDINITLEVIEKNMEEVADSNAPAASANGVIKALLGILAETYLSLEQQQRVQALIKLHSYYAYGQRETT